ncbi:MAG TPA: hypothetical protein VLB79_09135 [Solirubrobacterales bacterium]|nr:hypothetical protein [Solirubrobacterales bacterium]
MRPHFENDTVSAIGRAWHDLGLGTIVGSNLFAQVGWHPALRDVSDERERGRVTNEAWRRYGAVNALALTGIVSGWLGARAFEATPDKLTERERRIARAKDILTGVIAVTGIASGALGNRFYGMAEDGAVPLRDGDHPSSHAPEKVTRAKRALSALGRIQLASALTLGVVQAGMAQVNYRRPPLKRVFRRTY